MKTHQERVFLLDRYFSGEMTEKEEKVFLDLLDKDAILAKEYNETKEVFGSLGSIKALELKETIERIYAQEASEKLHRQFNLFTNKTTVAVAAVFIGLLIISVCLFNNKRQTNKIEEQIVEVPQKTSSPFFKTPLNRRLEVLIESNFRNEVTILKTPDEDIMVDKGDTLHFAWKKFQHGEITINIYDVGDNIIYQQSCAGVTAQIKSPNNSGIYYWILETTEEIIEIGRFYVR